MKTPHRLVHISPFQFSTMITAGYLALGMFYFPRQSVMVAGREALWSIWLDGLIAFGSIKLTFAVNHLVPGEPFTTFSPALLSKPIGYIMGLYTIVYHLALTIVAVVPFSFVINNLFLAQTPLWAIDGSIIAASIYMAWGGTASLARVIETAYIPVILITFIGVIFLLARIRHAILLIPPNTIHVIPILKGAWQELVLFIGFELSVSLYPFLRREDRARAEKYTYYWLAMVLIVLTIFYEVTIGTLGPHFLSVERWPIITISFFISKVGMLLIILWTIIVATFLALRLWCLVHDLRSFMPWDSPASYPYSLLAFGFTILCGSLSLPNARITEFLTEHYIVPIGVVYIVGTPLFTLAVSHFRKQTLESLRLQDDIATSPPD